MMLNYSNHSSGQRWDSAIRQLMAAVGVMLLAGAVCCDETAGSPQESATDFKAAIEHLRNNGTPAAPLPEVRPGHRPEFPRVIKGSVTDSIGKPVVGAQILWGRLYDESATQESVSTDGNGFYAIETSNVGAEHGLSVVAKGFCGTTRYLPSPGQKSAPTEMNVQLEADREIEVSVVNEAGDPIPGVEVKPMTPQSGFNSSFSMVSYPKPLPGHKDPTHVNGDGLCRLRGLRPAPTEYKDIFADDSTAEKTSKENFNSQGWISLRISANGESIHDHQITIEEYVESRGRIRVVIPDYSNPVLRKARNGAIHGRVVDPDGQPIQEYDLTVRYQPEPIHVKDVDGRFQWGTKLDPEHDYEVRIFAKGFAPQLAGIVPDETREKRPWEINLERKPSTEFLLFDQLTQSPIPNARVLTGVAKPGGSNYIEWNTFDQYADGYHGLESVLHMTSDAHGRVSLPEGPKPSTLIILPAGYGRAVIMPEQRPQVGADGVIRIPLSPEGVIQGMRAAGSRIARDADYVSLHYQSSDGFNHMYHGEALNAEGGFRYDSLAPGKYLISLMQREVNLSSTSWSQSLVIEAGKTVNVELGQMTGTLSLTGRTRPFTRVALTREKKQPVEFAGTVALSETEPTVSTVSDVDGYFEIQKLQRGLYEIEYGHRHQFSSIAMLTLPIKTLKVLMLTEDTHLDALTGVITPSTAAVIPETGPK